MMKTAIIIDDESLARDLVKEYNESLNLLKIIAEFQDGFSGLRGINELKPDIVFLDIQMPKLNGFEMLELLDEKPEIIFTTAYDQFAIKAFELNAVDYLLKPFSPERFNEAVSRAINRIETGRITDAGLKKLLEHCGFEEEILTRIVVKSRNSVLIIPASQVHLIEAQDDYVMIYTENAHYLKEKTLQYYENHLDPNDFLRVHRSYIIRIDMIDKIEPYEKSTHVAILKSGRKVPVSKSGKDRLKKKLDF